MKKENVNKEQLILPIGPGGITSDIQNRILTIRGLQILLDRDLAELYGVSTKVLNQTVKRNAQRFPDGFMFQLTKDEFVSLRSQIVTSNVIACQGTRVLGAQAVTSKRGGARYCPYAFTEHGIVMLSSLLKSATAIEVSVRIVNAFVALRKFILANAQVFQRLDNVERRQVATDDKVNEILNRLNVEKVPQQGVFYDGQLWDACSLMEKLIGRASKTILLIDSWVGNGTLDMLAKKQNDVTVEIITSMRGNKIASTDLVKFNAQYGGVTVRTSDVFHDRFLILDDKELYLIGASLKDLGKKCFGFTRMDSREIAGIKARF